MLYMRSSSRIEKSKASTVENQNWRAIGLTLTGFLIIFMLFSSNTTASVEGNLVGMWHFDEATGDTLFDSSANMNNGKIHGASWATGINGSALSFDGKNDYIDIPDSPSLDPSGEFSIEVWFKSDKWFSSNGWSATILSKYTDSNNQFRIAFDESQNGRIGVSAKVRGIEIGRMGIGGVSLNIWHHLAVVFTNPIKIYLDGVDITSENTCTWSRYTGDSHLYIGKRGDGGFFNGIIDEVTIYNKALTPKEIKEHYEKNKPKNSIIAKWNLDEGSGNTAHDSINDNNGKIYGASWTTGISGAALRFDNRDDYIEIPNKNGIYNLVDSWAIMAWVKPYTMGWDSRNDPIIWKIARNGRNEDTFYIAWTRGNKFVAGLERSSDGRDFSVVSHPHPPNHWYHVTGVYDGRKLLIYVDGRLEGEKVIGKVVAYTGPAPLRIGNILNSNHGYRGVFNGLIDEVRIYKGALSASQIREVYASYQKQIASKTVIAKWSFNENKGLTLHDQINRNNGRIRGATWTSGVEGSALYFDGVNDYVEIPDNQRFSLHYRGELTITAWVKVLSINTDNYPQSRQPIIAKGYPGQWEWALYIYDDLSVGFSTWQCSGSGHSEISGGRITLGKWHFVAASYKDNVVNRVYLDGREVAIGTVFRGNACDGKRPIRIGSREDGQFLNAVIDEVTVYSKTLSRDEIKSIYQSIKPPEEKKGLISKWSFNEGVGTYTRDSVDGNNGVIHGAKWVKGVNGSALLFDGRNDYIDMGNDPSLKMVDSFTISAWIYPTGSRNSGIIVNKEGEYEIAWYPDGSIRYAIANRYPGWRYVDTGVKIPIGRWSHIVWTYSSIDEEITLYVNGVKRYTGVGRGVIGDHHRNWNNFWVGYRQYGAQPFKGMIDEVYVYNKVLSDEEILDLYNSIIYRNGVIAQWHLDERKGGYIYDSIDEHNGVIHKATWTTGVNGSALQFNGKGYVIVEDSPILKPDKYSVEVWVKIHSPQLPWDHGGWVIGKEYNYAGYGIAIGGREPAVYHSDGHRWHRVESNIDLTLDEWHQLVATYDGETVKIYVDGILRNSHRYGFANTDDPLIIGAWHGSHPSRFFNGVIDEITIYSKPLDDSTIRKHYIDTIGRYRSRIAAKWSFNEGRGEIAHDNIHGNDGRLHNVNWVPGVNNSGLSFNGENSYVEIPYSKDFALNTWSFEAWVMPKDSKYTNGIIGTRFGSDYTFDIKFQYTKGWHGDIGDGNRWLTTKADYLPGNIRLNKWYHLVYVVQPNRCDIYVNGEHKKTITYHGTPLLMKKGQVMRLGDSYNREYGNILIDEVTIYSRVLTAEEIKQHYLSNKKTGLIAQWHLDEGRGGITRDSIDENNGILHSTKWVKGIKNNALSFNGIGSYIEIPGVNINPLRELTIIAWLKWNVEPSTGQHWANIISKNGDNEWQIQHSYSNDKFEFAVATKNTRRYVWSTTKPEKDKWYQVAGVYDGRHIKIYVNGKLENMVSLTGEIRVSNSNINIGRRSWGDRYFNGVIDEISVYAKALSDQEIQEKYLEVISNYSTPPVTHGYIDLVITDIYVDGSTVYYRIQNIGNETVNSSITYLYVDGELVAQDMVDIMAGGQTNTEWFQYEINLTETSHRVTVIADGNNAINETNEENNERTEVFQATIVGKPDLVINSIYIDGETIYYRIQNIGSRTIESSYTYLYIDGKLVAVDKVGVMAPQQTNTEWFNYKWRITGNSDEIKIVADGNNTVEEENEDNNVRIKEITSSKPGKPDLIISDIFIGGDKVYYRIQNIGEATANSSRTTLTVNGVVVATNTEREIIPGESLTESFNYNWNPLGNETRIVVVTADSTNTVDEKDENNNQRTETFAETNIPSTTTGNIDLVIVDIFLSGNQINYRIQNLGDQQVMSSTTYIYVNDELVGVDPVGVMAAQQMNTEGFDYPWQSLSKGDVIKVVADGPNNIQETNELNNEKTHII